jgi:magnesium chelatase family protein
MLFIGSPGTGKTMLARRLPTIMPPLTPAESLSTTRIYSALGRLKADEPLLATRPFRDPHHTIRIVLLYLVSYLRMGVLPPKP